MAAFHLACRGGKLGVVRALLRPRADPGLRNEQGVTPAALATDPKIVALMSGL